VGGGQIAGCTALSVIVHISEKDGFYGAQVPMTRLVISGESINREGAYRCFKFYIYQPIMMNLGSAKSWRY